MSYVLTENFYRSLAGKMGTGTTQLIEGFINTAGDTFSDAYANGFCFYTGYISSDSSTISKSDYALPDDVISCSITCLKNATYVDEAGYMQHLLNYQNNTDSAITVRKVLLLWGYTQQALMVEELLDTPVTLAVGDTFARIYTFKLTAE